MKRKPERKHFVSEEPQPPKHSYKPMKGKFICSRCGNELGTNNGCISDCPKITEM